MKYAIESWKISCNTMNMQLITMTYAVQYYENCCRNNFHWTRSHPTFTEHVPTQLSRNTFPFNFHGTRSHPTSAGHVPTQLSRNTLPPNFHGTRSHPTFTEHVPFQLSRNTFPPNFRGTRSHPTFTGHVPTQLSNAITTIMKTTHNKHEQSTNMLMHIISETLWKMLSNTMKYAI